MWEISFVLLCHELEGMAKMKTRTISTLEFPRAHLFRISRSCSIEFTSNTRQPFQVKIPRHIIHPFDGSDPQKG